MSKRLEERRCREGERARTRARMVLPFQRAVGAVFVACSSGLYLLPACLKGGVLG